MLKNNIYNIDREFDYTTIKISLITLSIEHLHSFLILFLYLSDDLSEACCSIVWRALSLLSV